MQSPSLSESRDAALLSIGFLLDCVEIWRGDRAVLDTLLIVSVVQANIEMIAREPQLQRAYAAADAPPPDELRRAISINALANSLRLPYETARRRIVQLEQAGEVVITDKGVYVPQRNLATPAYFAAVTATTERIRAFYGKLREARVLRDDFPAPHDAPVPPQELVRAIMRVHAAYFLRVIDAVSLFAGDVVSAMVLLGVLEINTERLTYGQAAPDADESSAFSPDALRRPARISLVARRLSIPDQTVRRYIDRLTERGLVARAAGGVLVPAAVLANPLCVRLVRENLSHLNRAFSTLAAMGVLAAWDQARAPAERAEAV